jgi:hypothetical protein
MRNKITTVLSVLAALLVVLCTTGPAEASSPARPNLQSGGAPTVVSYQGRVTVGGPPYDGPGYFKFAIVGADGTTTYWSNDGTSTNGGEPIDAVRLTVTNGLFNVLLGDTTLTGMTQYLAAEDFERPDCYLRVWFSSDSGTYSQLTPDTRIAAVPYALQAEEAVDASNAAYAANADQLDGQHGSYYQARVSGACAVGSTVRAINADGTVVCQAGALLNRSLAPAANTSTTLDAAGPATGGQYTSVAIGTDGLPLISYYDATNFYLKVAHCDDPACASRTVTMLGYGGLHTSVTIGADGLPLISCGGLMVAHCEDLACTSAALATPDSGGEYTSVTIGADGLPLISYYNSGDLMVAHCEDLACTSVHLHGLDTGYEDVGQYTSVTIGADGLPLISYYEATNGDLKVAHCDDPACGHATLGGPDGESATRDIGEYTSVTIGADGLPLISYYNATLGNLKVAHCENPACTSAVVTTLDDGDGDDVGRYTSVTIGADGLPLISYYDATNGDLKVAHCHDLACTSAVVTTLDGGGGDDVGWYTSVTIGADGLPLISYYDATNEALKVFHCANAFCTDYFRRR